MREARSGLWTSSSPVDTRGRGTSTSSPVISSNAISSGKIAADLTLPGLFHPIVKYTLATDAGRERLAADAKRAGQRITALCMANRFAEQPELDRTWHHRQADECEKARDWFAVAFHLDQMLRADPDNADYRKRLERARAEQRVKSEP